MTDMSQDEVKKLLCYNRGCGQTFDSTTNSENSCCYHPGIPVFHDAYKKWSCCEKKTTDFTEFLNIKGCTKSYHSNVKPPEEVKNKEKENNSNKDEVYTYVPPQPIKPTVTSKRPDPNTPMIKLASIVSPSLTAALEKLQLSLSVDKNEENESIIALGTSCKNGGCKALYKGENSVMETCLYHPGTPVFHEGLKFWTCCVKRTSDFNSFLEQAGCSTGNHVWHKSKQLEKKANCRYDWHQTGNFVVISVYSKCANPEFSFIEANPVKLKIHIVFGEERTVFETELILCGIIDVANSSVNFLGTKVEIKLKKEVLVLWSDLNIDSKVLHKNQINSKLSTDLSGIEKA